MYPAFEPITLAGAPPLPPLVLLHGFMGDAGDWRSVAESLAGQHHVLAVKLPGHGPGWDGVDVASIDFGICAAEIANHLKQLGPTPPALIGYSMGGRVALYLAHCYPGLVSRLVLESASPGLDSDEKRASRAAQDDALADRLESMPAGSGAFRDFLEEWYAMPLFASLQSRPNLLLEVIERRSEGCVPARLAGALRGLGTGRQPSLWEELHAFATPTLIITGEQDRKFRIIAEDMALACPAMASEILTGCGHNVHLECPEAFTTVVRAFLNPPG